MNLHYTAGVGKLCSREAGLGVEIILKGRKKVKGIFWVLTRITT
jgi:hypothetical protein